MMKMVTYYNKGDMEYYSCWVAQKMFPLPDNYAVVVEDSQFSKKIEKHLQKWHGAFELGIRPEDQRDLIRELHTLVDEYEDAVKSGTCISPVCWFGRVKDDKNKFRSGSYSFLVDNNMKTPDGYTMTLISMSHFLLHFLGVRLDVFSVEKWIESREDGLVAF